MIKAGITGGIGSGKTTVCKVFETLGIPVFYADGAARWLMENDAALIKNIRALFGEAAYAGNKLDRGHIATQAFSDPQKLQKLNALTHPATISYGKTWLEKQRTAYAIKEAALLFESGSHAEMDIMIGVYAPDEIRIDRTMKRNNITRSEVVQRMAQQMNEEEKMSLCDYVILNDDVHAVIPQVMQLHKEILQRTNL